MIRRWYCPMCKKTDATKDDGVGTRYHVCPKMRMLSVPLVLEGVNATLPVSLVMVRAIREYEAMSGGVRVGFKPAGGISKAKDALAYLALMRDELGLPWTRPALFRFGASSLLADIERQLEHFATGRYSVAWRHPTG